MNSTPSTNVKSNIYYITEFNKGQFEYITTKIIIDWKKDERALGILKTMGKAKQLEVLRFVVLMWQLVEGEKYKYKEEVAECLKEVGKLSAEEYVYLFKLANV